MSTQRKIYRVFRGIPTVEGAGVHLKRVFGFNQVPLLDPFLLLDDFHSDNPSDYIAGFPWHPHRGIETVSYVLHGSVEHGDSLGNSGTISTGDIQWMTAGRGIGHQEMPKSDDGLLWGFQLWVNLPASQKMMKPRYQEIGADDIPEVELQNGIRIRVLSGKIENTRGPVKDIVVDPEYSDVRMPENSSFSHSVNEGYRVFAYVLEGSGFFDQDRSETVNPEHLVLFGDGDELTIKTNGSPLRFLLVSGKPLGEPVAWHGPIVMNTREELDLAFKEYENGTFLRHE